METTKNPLLATDAYKPSHYLQLPEGVEKVKFYIAPRKKLFKEKEYILWGLTYAIKQYLLRPLTMDDVMEAKAIYDEFNIAGTKYPFNYEGAKKVVEECNGYIPLRIRAFPEGQPFDKYNIPCVIVEADHKDFIWFASFIETLLQRNVWYGSTVATQSRAIRKYLKKIYNETVEPEMHWTLDYRLHDFGARGATVGEQAALGGAGHLINFNGTDTMEAVWLLKNMYGMQVKDIACSIPAAEHSTVTSWGPNQESERRALENMIKQFGKMPMFAFVSDSYDFKGLIDNVWCDPELIAKVRAAGVTPVVRPDSGDPNEMVMYALNKLAAAWGTTENKLGYKVLNGIAVIQGDGMDYNKIIKLYHEIIQNKFSPQNVAVGMGGGLLQKLNRDDMSWSMKCYQAQINGNWINIMKNPKTDTGKKGWNPENGLNLGLYEDVYFFEPGMEKPVTLDLTNDYFGQVRNRARA